MIICKFGGSSIDSSDNIINVCQIIRKKLIEHRITCVFSAFGNTTNIILNCAQACLNTNIQNYITSLDKLRLYTFDIINALFKDKNLTIITEKIEKVFKKMNNICKGIYYLKDLNDKTKDRLLCYGEIISSTILYHYLKQNVAHSIKLLDSRSVIKTNSNYGKALPNYHETNKLINQAFHDNINLFIAGGFISSDSNNNPTTLGRGGGDYSAAIYGHCLNCKQVEIWTDVNGIMTTDPRKVSIAFTIPKISYQEMLDLSHYGANVIYTPTIMPLYKKKIPILIKNAKYPNNHGTEIHYNISHRDTLATAVSSIEKISILKIFGEYLIGNIGFSGKLFSIFSKQNINITMISQSSSEYSIYIVIYQKDYSNAIHMLNQYYEKIIKRKLLTINSNIDSRSIISIVTHSQKNILSISNIVYPLLKSNNINIYAQTTSDHNISLIVDRCYIDKILTMIHNHLFLNKKRNLFIIGTGVVGKELIKQLINIGTCNIVLIANSKKYLLDINGVCDYETKIQNGPETNIEHIINNIIDLNLPKSIFIDCTSSESIFPFYNKLLERNIGVVTPNKKANTCNYAIFNTLIKYNNYKFETTVGAGLPIIHSIKNLQNCQDTVIKIEAILSGSLSYIFTTFMNNDKSFSDIVKEAQNKGFTEPNPLDDLIGADVARKMLIITRLLGFNYEMNNIQNDIFLSENCLSSKCCQDFLCHLETMNDNMNEKKEYAIENSLKLKHVAILENNKVHIKLLYVNQDHPFYNLQGSDNMIMITSEFYKHNPFIIRGPGAGAQVTASGIISDIFNI